jgi:hypothetical protein
MHTASAWPPAIRRSASLALRSLAMRTNGVMSSSMKSAAGRVTVHADTAAARTSGMAAAAGCWITSQVALRVRLASQDSFAQARVVAARQSIAATALAASEGEEGTIPARRSRSKSLSRRSVCSALGPTVSA